MLAPHPRVVATPRTTPISPSKPLRWPLLCATALVALVAVCAPAQAQPAQDGHWVRISPADQPLAGEVDPPLRVGRVGRIDGSLSLRPAGAEDWVDAERNYPVAAGTTWWTPQGSRARFDLASGHIAIDGGSELGLDSLDDAGLRATLASGEAYLRLRTPQRGESWMVRTPRGVVSLDGAGRYAIEAGDGGAPTRVTVLEGTARVMEPGPEVTIGPGQAALLTGEEAIAARLVPAEPDAFVAAMVATEQAPAAPIQPVRPPAVVEQMPGGTDLGGYGTWNNIDGYGAVWYPRVDPGWAPYRDGRWSWLQPWGWTWVDNAPWGFAPSHYGRWSEIGGRWGWLPGPPAYAPAMVSFWGIGAGAALAAGSIGWAPLGPGEPYRPWYRATPRYHRDMNAGLRPRVEGPRQLPGFGQRPGATVVPTGIMTASRPVGPAALRPSERLMGAARPVEGLAPVPPTAATAGITPGMAQRMNLVPAPPGLAVPPREAARGPSVVQPGAPGAWPPGMGGMRGWNPPPPGIPPAAGPMPAHNALRPPPGAPDVQRPLQPGRAQPSVGAGSPNQFAPPGPGPSGMPNQFAPPVAGLPGGGPGHPVAPVMPPQGGGMPPPPNQFAPAPGGVAPPGPVRPVTPGVPPQGGAMPPPPNQFGPAPAGVGPQGPPQPFLPPGGNPLAPPSPGARPPAGGPVPGNQFAPPPRDRAGAFGPGGGMPPPNTAMPPPARPVAPPPQLQPPPMAVPRPVPQPMPVQPPPAMRPPQMPPPNVVMPPAAMARPVPQPMPVQPPPAMRPSQMAPSQMAPPQMAPPQMAPPQMPPSQFPPPAARPVPQAPPPNAGAMRPAPPAVPPPSQGQNPPPGGPRRWPGA